MTPIKVIYRLLTDRETNRQMDERNPPLLRFCPFLNILDSSKRKNPEFVYTLTIKAVYSRHCQLFRFRQWPEIPLSARSTSRLASTTDLTYSGKPFKTF